MKPRYAVKVKSSLIFLLLLFSTPFLIEAQEPEPEDNDNIQRGGVLEEDVHLPSSFTETASIERDLQIALSSDDMAVWTDEVYNLTGNWTWTIHNDAEILEIDFIGDSYSVNGNEITFLGVDGYIKIVWRTSGGVARNGQYLSFGGYVWASQPFNLNATISFPDFYSGYIDSISPSDYSQQPGSASWARSSISEFSFSLTFDLNISIESLQLPSGNKTAHHTSNWPDFVFRRAQWLSVIVEFNGEFDQETDSLRWSIKGPNQSSFAQVPLWSSSLADSSWAVREGEPIGQFRTVELFIPVGSPVGRYALKVALYRNTGDGNILQDSAELGEFYIIFNPWNDDADSRYDEDVFNPNFNGSELDWYAASGSGTNYYPDGNSTVSWTLSPFSSDVFTPVIDEIEGVSSASQAMRLLVDKTRWFSSEPSSHILEGKWGWSLIPYKKDWKSVPNILSSWDNGSKHPTGQCMDFGGLVSAVGRSIGVPTRMLTCVECYDPHNDDTWNFHVWNEVWTNEINASSWSPVDGTYDIGPTTRGNSFIQDEVSTSTGVFAYNARTGSKENILSDYWNPLQGRQDPLIEHEIAETQDLVLDVRTDQTIYDYGETVTIEVEVTNTGANIFNGDLDTVVSFVDYAGRYEIKEYPIRNVTIPTNDKVIETYSFSKTDYVWNGEFIATAEMDSTSDAQEFTVDGGLNLVFSAPSDVLINDYFEMTLNITNDMLNPISGIEVEIYFPSSVAGVSNPDIIAIPTLAVGETYVYMNNISIGEAGLQHLQAYGSSLGAGFDQVSVSVNVLDHPNLEVTLEVPTDATSNSVFPVKATIMNSGDFSAENTQVTLNLSDGLSSNDALTKSVGLILPGGVEVVQWEMTAANTGVHSLFVTATETSINEVERVDELVIVSQAEHDIDLEASQYTIVGQQPAAVTLTLYNHGNVQDMINIDVVSNNPTIGFSLTDNGVPVQGVIAVPAQSSRQLLLEVIPHEFEEGLITIYAISDLNPNAAEFISITVLESAVNKMSDDFTYSDGWRVDKHVRETVDVNNDGLADIIGFGSSAVYVSLSEGSSFRLPQNWIWNYAYLQGWRTDKHVRTLADVNGDGRADIVGFGANGVFVSVSNGSGFDAPVKWSSEFGYLQGYRVEKHLRKLADVNGDNLADIVGFGANGVFVALSDGSSFADPVKWSSEFGYLKGWTVDKMPREVADVNGDGKADIVGFGGSGTYVALSGGTSFGAPVKWIGDFGFNHDWLLTRHIRQMADVNNDGLSDIVGFGDAATYAAISTGSNFNSKMIWTDEFSYDRGWLVEKYPRMLADHNGDGREDIAGFGNSGVYVLLSDSNFITASSSHESFGIEREEKTMRR